METLRRAVRCALGYNSSVYRAGAKSIDCLCVLTKGGVGVWNQLRKLANEKDCTGPICSIDLPNLQYPLLARPGTKDAHTIINNIIREEYGQVAPRKEPEWMIDAGAYIGDTTAYFLSKFSKLKVIALEPNPENYEMARQNLAPYGNRAIILRKGLYSSEQVQYFSGAGTGSAISGSGFEINCTTLASLMQCYSIPRFDILKMDIEGAEEPIFQCNPEQWLSRTDLIIIEIHSSQAKSLISGVLEENGYCMRQFRSVWYCCRENTHKGC